MDGRTAAARRPARLALSRRRGKNPGVMPEPAVTAAGPARRLAALFYDLLLLGAVLFFGTLVLLPFTGGEAITPQDSGPWEAAYRAWLLLLALGYFCLSWVRRGQTLGMMSWKIRLLRDDGGLPRWRDALLRFALACVVTLAALAGLWALGTATGWPSVALGVALLLPAPGNYLPMLGDPAERTLLDRATRCRVVRLP